MVKKKKPGGENGISLEEIYDINYPNSKLFSMHHTNFDKNKLAFEFNLIGINRQNSKRRFLNTRRGTATELLDES